MLKLRHPHLSWTLFILGDREKAFLQEWFATAIADVASNHEVSLFLQEVI